MIGVVAHDPGGAEIISSYIRQEGLECNYCLAGPAYGIFLQKLGEIENLSVERLIDSCDWVLCGSSFLSDLEWKAIGLARQAGKRSVVMLDHWINYQQRFFRHNDWHFPDEVWVGDELSIKLASASLPNVKVSMVPNAYFRDVERELANIPRPKHVIGEGSCVLYVCEPLREAGITLHGDERYWGYTEEDALRYFLSNVGSLSANIDSILVRPHPRESRDKYDWAVEEFNLPVVCGEDKTLLEQVVASDIVAGCATMAMVVGLLAGKRVVSCIPPGGKTTPLPHPDIEKMDCLLAMQGEDKQNVV